MTKHVLIIEDDLAIAELIAEILEFEGFTVVHALDGEALRIAAESSPAVVLLDLMMPEMDGFEVARRLRANPATASIPIIVMSAGQRAREGATRIGAAGYLAKPFDLQDLLTTVRAHSGTAA